jgi:hypothetical protein
MSNRWAMASRVNVSPRLFDRVELRESGGYHTAAVRRNGSSGVSRGEWSEDGASEPWSDEPIIQIDNTGERKSFATKTVWKSATDNTPKPKTGSFLRNVEDL